MPAGAAEAIERIAGHVIAALHRYFFDRIGHVFDGDLDETVGDLFGAPPVADLFRKRSKSIANRLGIERQILPRSEDLRKKFRNELPHHDIGVGHRQRTAAAVAFRSGIGASRIRTDAEACAVIVQDRSAARRDGVNEHHWRAHAHAGDFGFECPLVFAGEMRHVGRRAAHVEADHPRKAGRASGLGHADHPGCRTGQDCILAAKQIGRGEPARRHHEHQSVHSPRLRRVAVRRAALSGGEGASPSTRHALNDPSPTPRFARQSTSPRRGERWSQPNSPATCAT